MSIPFNDLLPSKSLEKLIEEIVELLSNPTEEFDDVPF